MPHDSADSADSPADEAAETPAAGSGGESGGAADAAGGFGPAQLRAVAVAVGVTVLALAVSVVGGVAAVVPVLLFELDVASAPVFLGLTVAGQVGFAVAGYAVARRWELAVPFSVPTGREFGIGVGGALLAVGVVAVLSAVASGLGLVPDSVIGEAATADRRILLGLAVLSLFVVAPAEEYLFRGVIQGRLRRSFGPTGAVAVASLLFGSLHLANYAGRPAAVLAGALLVAATGSVLGALYEYTGNLAVPVVAHGLYNALLLSVAYATL